MVPQSASPLGLGIRGGRTKERQARLPPRGILIGYVPTNIHSVLGLAKVAFGPYLLISWPIQFGYALAFVWFGNSLAGSHAWRILSAVAAVLAVALATRVLRRGIRSRGAPAPIAADGPR